MDLWCSLATCLTVYEEITGSNPVRSANFYGIMLKRGDL